MKKKKKLKRGDLILGSDSTQKNYNKIMVIFCTN